MRIRQIKPGICCNEDIAELGMGAYILFTGLWMLADREGRFEWRPQKIKALVMPLWNVSSEDVENLLKSLSQKGFIHRYEAGEKAFGHVVNWKKHQRVDSREAPSEFPEPPVTAASAQTYETRRNSAEFPRQDGGILPGNLELGTGCGSGGERKTRGSVQKSQITPPPPNGTQRKTPERKQPAQARAAGDGPHESPPKAHPPDFWPHQPEDVQLIRESLTALGKECGLPPPDDALIRRVLDVGRGRSGKEIHGLLRGLFLRGKFREMRSWGFIPLVVEQWIRAA